MLSKYLKYLTLVVGLKTWMKNSHKNYPFAFIERDVSTVSVVESFVVEILMSASTSQRIVSSFLCKS